MRLCAVLLSFVVMTASFSLVFTHPMNSSGREGFPKPVEHESLTRMAKQAREKAALLTQVRQTVSVNPITRAMLDYDLATHGLIKEFEREAQAHEEEAATKKSEGDVKRV